ncbi:hypothetical protein BGX34_008640 [Mortierella sp. NVP85]|nr:hypothetical protein BGX34_008640 [Mortierella sp. NVP85]
MPLASLKTKTDILRTPQPAGPVSRRVSQRAFGWVLALTLALCVSVAWASSGDRQPLYNDCVHQCDQDICHSSNLSSQQHHQEASLRLLHWTCLDNCRYNCMHAITQDAILRNEPVHQYHGKWPFHRFLGMQEPASVLFSLLNGYMHVRAWPTIKRTIPEGYYMRPFYLGYVVMGVNTWLWSAVYHSRDWPSTEKLDYFSAGAAIMFGFYYSVIRITRMVQTRWQLVWTVVCVIPLLLHIGFLTFVRFDYGYNMLATGGVGVVHNLMWVGWSIANRDRPYAWEPTLWGILISLAMSLEVLDFAPLWGILDAHSLWHAATILLIPVWYRFLLKDTEWEIQHMKGVLRTASHRD